MSGGGIRVGIVTGLAFEADIIRAAAQRLNLTSILFAYEGPGAAQSRRAAERLIGRGATHLLSFGIAAALDPDLEIGTVIVADGLRRSGGREIPSDRPWAKRLRRGLPGTRAGNIADSAGILTHPTMKADVRSATGAEIADMESYGMAEAADGRPCAAIRVVSDSAAQTLPRAALAGTNADGTVSIARVLAAILLNPFQIPALYRLGRSTEIARTRLRLLADLGLARGFFAGGLDE